MTSIYYVKVYVDKPGQTQPEIRRFPVDISPERDTFADLHGKVLPLLPAGQQKAFTLQYVDEDNERITFSTDDEVRAAIALNKDGNVLKVYAVAVPVATEGNNQPTTTSGNTERHVNVKCDGCNSEVVGFRFKCLVCPDFDLCEKCSAIGKHSEHNMIKITKPGAFHMPGSHFGPPPPPMFPHGLHFPPPPPHHPHGHHFKHHHRHGHHKRFPQMVHNPDMLQQIQSQIPQWLPKPEHVAHAQAHMKQHLDAIKTTAQGHVQNSKEYLQSVGQMLQKALSPFGIDCDYRVEDSIPTASSTTTSTSTESTTTTSTKSNDAEQKEEEKQQVESAVAAATPSMASASSTSSLVEVTADDMVVINDDDIQQSPTSEGAIPIIEDLTPEQAIQGCLEKLIAMGFPSNNEHLIELVRSKCGDINAVLDAINNHQ